MIPTENQCKQLWEKYNFPEYKRRHVALVARVARFLANKLTINNSQASINYTLLVAGALLHDIDKNIPKKVGEQHPDTAVRILKEEGMEEVAELVKTHSLHTILDPSISPKTWEEKLLYLADKMVKEDIITVDTRFALWNDEHLPLDAQKVLDAAYLKAKALEKELFDRIGFHPEEVAKLA